MHLKTVALLALSAVAFAADKRQIVPTDSVGFSVLSVLATAIPAESQSAALKDPASFASAIASSIAAGNPPEWYKALPTDVKSALPVLYPAPTTAATSEAPTASSTPFSVSATNSIALNSTSILTVSSATLKPTESSATDDTSDAPETTLSTGGAAYPTAVVGAGIAGALGFLGMLAM